MNRFIMEEWMNMGPVWICGGDRAVAINDKTPHRFEDRISPEGAWGWQYGPAWLEPDNPATTRTIPRVVHDYLPDNPDYPEVTRDRAANRNTCLRWKTKEQAVATFLDACLSWATHRREHACSLITFVDHGRQLDRRASRSFSFRNRTSREWVRIAAFRPELGICGEDFWRSWVEFESGFRSAHQDQNNLLIDDYRHACDRWVFAPDARPQIPFHYPEAVLRVFGDIVEESGYPDAGATALAAAEVMGRVRADLGRALSVIRDVEWDGDPHVGKCPACWAIEGNPHAATCKIGLILDDFQVE